MTEKNYMTEEKKKTNWWQVATIVLGIIICILIIYPADKIVNLPNDITIKESDLKHFNNLFGNQTIKICDIIENKCVYVRVMS